MHCLIFRGVSDPAGGANVNIIRLAARQQIGRSVWVKVCQGSAGQVDRDYCDDLVDACAMD